MKMQFFFLVSLVLGSARTTCTTETIVPSFDELTTIPATLTCEIQDEPVPNESAIQSELNQHYVPEESGWKHWATVHIERIALACLLKYYAVQAWITRTVFRRTT